MGVHNQPANSSFPWSSQPTIQFKPSLGSQPSNQPTQTFHGVHNQPTNQLKPFMGFTTNQPSQTFHGVHNQTANSSFLWSSETWKLFLSESVAVSQKPKLYSANRRKVNPPVPEVLPLSATSVLSSAPLSSSSSSSSSALPCRQEQSVKEFLWQNIEMVFAMTINDNVGWHGTEPIFEVWICDRHL